MNQNESHQSGSPSPPALVSAYRHDAHKLNRRSHESARETYAGVRVNEPVPLEADKDAAALSRPTGEPTETVPTHVTNRRISLLKGSPVEPDNVTDSQVDRAIRRLLTPDAPQKLHQAWLNSDIAAAFNESPYYPYTSLKYHTLLVAALLSNYQQGHQFAELSLTVDPPDKIQPDQTIYSGPHFSLRLDHDEGNQPSAQLPPHPHRSWSTVWTQLSDHPLNTDINEYHRVLDANLRRISAWSTAIQYIEDFHDNLRQ